MNKETDKAFRETPPDVDINQDLEDELNNEVNKLPERMRKALGSMPNINEKG